MEQSDIYKMFGQYKTNILSDKEQKLKIKNEFLSRLNDVKDGKTDNRFLILSGILPKDMPEELQLRTIFDGPLNEEQKRRLKIIGLDPEKFNNEIINNKIPKINSTAVDKVSQEIVVENNIPELITTIEEPIKKPITFYSLTRNQIIERINNVELLSDSSSNSDIDFLNEYDIPTMDTRMNPAPLEFILSIKKRSDDKIRQAERRKKNQLRLEKKYERQKFWKEFKFSDYINGKLSKCKKFLASKINKVTSFFNDIMFQLSLSRTQRRLVKGWNPSTNSTGLIKVALKRKIDLNEMKNMNSRIDAIPE